MSKVLFAKGTKASLPTSGQIPYKIFFTTDTYEMYVADASGVPQRYNNEILNVNVLPSVGIEGKIYVYDNLGEISLQTYYNGAWVNLTNNGLDTDTFELMFGLKSKSDTFTYNGSGDISQINKVYVDGTPSENTVYTYDLEGNIATETKSRMGKTITNTFSYDIDGNITKIDTVVV